MRKYDFKKMSVQEIEKAIIDLRAETEAIIKETEAIKKETEAIKKETAAMHKKHLAEMKAMKKKGEAKHQKNLDEIEAIKKETEAIKKAGEAKHQKNLDEIEAIKKETAAMHKKHLAEMKAIKKKGEARHQKYLKEKESLRIEGDKITQELKQSQKDLNRQMFNLGVNIGLGVEESMYNLLSIYKVLDNINYDKVYKNNVYNDPIDNTTKGESDIIMINGKHAAIIEIKHRVTKHHIRKFYTEKLPIFLQYETKIKDKKIHVYFAGESVDSDVIKEAKKLGCGIIEPVHDDIVTIVKAS